MDSIEKQKAVLVSIANSSQDLNECNISLDELVRLLDAAGGSLCAKIVQIRTSYDAATCIGSGKALELKDICEKNDAKLVVFDNELSPSQIRNLERIIGNNISVIDRSVLILDIFALHAISGEGKLQVELAQLKYTAPRLYGKGSELSRLGGTIGTRGPGETQLETDKRHLKRRINALEQQLKELESNRLTMRRQRDKSGLVKIAIVGYSNAGKSTLLNYLTDAKVLSEDKLFATLDPTTRKLKLPNDETVLLTDTVGFIRNLPHHLIKAFRSTLDEAVYADLILIVCDITDRECKSHLDITKEILCSLGAEGKPTITVFNKIDMIYDLPDDVPDNTAFISSKTGKGVNSLLSMICDILEKSKKNYNLYFDYASVSKVASLHKDAKIISEEYKDDGIYIVATLDEKAKGMYNSFIIKI